MTDLYELTMAAGYWVDRRRDVATFELFTRRLPQNRSFLVFAGLDAVADYLENFHFTREEIAYLRGLPKFATVPAGFFDYLASLTFSGELWALPEGCPVFPNEPFLVVRAPITEAQLFETALLAMVNFPTSVASKAARVVAAAAGRPVVEFGARRAHGTEASLAAARAAYIGGCVGTSNVEAGLRFGLPLFGTLAHAWIMSFDDELEAFRSYQRLFPDNATLLIDTYDTVRAARRIVEAFQPGEVAGVRLDSGDIGALARQVREVLDRAGFSSTRILASGDLNEWSIRELLAAGAPIDAFGVGTDLTTVRDAPALGVVYKLVALELDGRVELKMKCSAGKATWPGAKQVWRHADATGRFSHDTVTFADEPAPDPAAFPLLHRVFAGGRRLEPAPTIDQCRDLAAAQVARLPESLRHLEPPAEPYPVRFSDRLVAAQAGLRAELDEMDTGRDRT
jgi:nicotinate phosphoribosyltransferase